MENHHEEPKPTNKWVATPIIMAFCVIAVLVTFLSLASGTCCGGECKDNAKTEQHGTTDGHGEETTTDNQSNVDTTAVTADSAATNEGEEAHGEGEGHGH